MFVDPPLERQTTSGQYLDMIPVPSPTWDQRYEALHLVQIANDADFHSWLLQWAALEAEIYEQNTALTRAFQADTTDQEAKLARQVFLTQQAPHLREQHDKTAQQAVGLGQMFTIPPDWRQTFLYFEVMARQALDPGGHLEGQVEVIAGDLTALFARRTYELDGQALSAQEVGRRSTSLDREVRRAAALSSRESLLRIAPQVAEKYRASLELRRELARRSGENTVYSHLWRLLERFDYTPQEVRQFRADVQTGLNPLLVEFRDKRRTWLGVEHLQPWDLTVDAFGARAVPRYTQEADIMALAARRLDTTLPGLGQRITQLYAEGYLDVASRPGKAARSYSDFLAHRHRPYVQTALQPTPGSYQVLFHELGHVAQLSGVGPEAAFWQYFPGVEMREFVAQVFELWSLDQLPEFFAFENPDAYRARFYEQTLSRMSAQCSMDEFQEWFYTTSEEVTAARMHEVWQEISDRYPSGVERRAVPSLAFLSQQLARRPLVGIEYALAWGWAFSFMENVAQDSAQAFGQLAQALALGNTRPLPELLQIAGVEFSISSQQLRLIDTTMRQALLAI